MIHHVGSALEDGRGAVKAYVHANAQQNQNQHSQDQARHLRRPGLLVLNRALSSHRPHLVEPRATRMTNCPRRGDGSWAAIYSLVAPEPGANCSLAGQDNDGQRAGRKDQRMIFALEARTGLLKCDATKLQTNAPATAPDSGMSEKRLRRPYQIGSRNNPGEKYKSRNPRLDEKRCDVAVD